MTYCADWERQGVDKYENMTGIYVRARALDGTYRTFDIGELTSASLLEWLRSRGGDNPWAEDVVGLLLGHGHLHEKPGDQ